MSKVTSILPREVRFADLRVDRWDFYYRSPQRRMGAKRVAKKFSAMYKALRKDARFAAPKLAMALLNEPMHWEVMSICQRPLHAHVKEMPFKTGWETVAGLTDWVQSSTAAHPALMDVTKIACYPTRSDAARGREVVMAPGKFYAAVHEPAPATSVQVFAEAYLASKVKLPVHFIHNNDPDLDAEALGDAWMQGYRNPHGFTSCMSDFGVSQYHPARFYACPGNGLSLAYITHDGERDGKIVARSIVNLEAKHYVRCYGDGRLARALEVDYKLEQCVSSALGEVECNALSRNGRLVAPYLDGDMQIEWDGSSSTCTVGGSGNYEAQETDGFASSGEPMSECNECEERCSEDDLAYSSHHEIDICPGCREQHFTYAFVTRNSQDWVRDDEVIHLGDTAYLNNPELLEQFDYHWSERECGYLHEDDAVYLNYVGDYVLCSDIVQLDVDYKHDSVALEEDTKKIVLDGETLTVHEDYDGPEDAEEEDEDEEQPAKQLAA